MAETPEPNPLRAYFDRNPGRLIDKWLHYFDVYHRHFARFRGKPVTMVEIGIFHGGSLEMWRDYLGPQARIIGVDINPRCKSLEGPGIEIMIGSQSDRAFLTELRTRVPKIDILIDDGGHHMHQQIITFEELYMSVAPDGVYLIEDLHTSYWQEYGGGYRHPFSFIEFSKHLIDQINAWHSRDPNSFSATPLTQTCDSLHYYDSMLVLEKRPRQKPVERMTGKPSFELRHEEVVDQARRGSNEPMPR